MAACQLKIELDDPRTPRLGAQELTGSVVIKTTDRVRCKGLTVSTVWQTHGRGNVASGEIDTQMIFEGEWEADREYRYPFTLESAAWPPTYNGHYLNVGQYIKAHASVPWSFDPKTQIEYYVVADTSPDDLKPPESKAPSNSWVGWIVGAVVLLIVIPLLGALLFLVPILLIGGGLYWFFRIFLPKLLLGNIQCHVEPLRQSPGKEIVGKLRFTPRRGGRINSITWTLCGTEKCISGSGSNRKTHHYEIAKRETRLAEAMELIAGQPVEFEFRERIPVDSPPSMKFSDNELNWVGTVRIDIPRWPDWVQETNVIVLPVPGMSTISQSPADLDEHDWDASEDDDDLEDGSSWSEPATASVSAAARQFETSEAALSFDDVADQIVKSRRDAARLETVMSAVQGLVFRVQADLQGKMYQSPTGLADATQWILARHPHSELQICLGWPERAKLPVAPALQWRGVATIESYDPRQDRLLMRVSE